MVGSVKLVLVSLLLLAAISAAAYSQASSLEIENYESEILVEKGWVRYLNVDVKNTGDFALSNTVLTVEGDKPDWFEVQTSGLTIQPNQSTSFLIKLYVPLEEEKGKYYFTLKAASGSTSATESFSVELFTSRSEVLLDQIESFRQKITELKSQAEDAEIRGKDVDSVMENLAEASPLLEAASNDVYNRQFDTATVKVREVETLIKKSEYDLSVAPQRSEQMQIAAAPLEWVLILGLVIIIILMFLWFFVLGKKVKIRRPQMKKVPGKIPGLKIKRLIRQERDSSKVSDEIRNLEEAESLLEEEYREGLLSKQSYEEMKSKYEEKILKLRTNSK